MMEFIIIPKEFWMRFLRKKSSYVVIGYFLENDLRLLVDRDSYSRGICGTVIFHSLWNIKCQRTKKGIRNLLIFGCKIPVVILLLYPRLDNNGQDLSRQTVWWWTRKHNLCNDGSSFHNFCKSHIVIKLRKGPFFLRKASQIIVN